MWMVLHICIGNSIISSAITDKQARVSFKKLQNSASPKDERYLRFLKTHECLFSVIAREIILLLINNIKRKCSNKHFVLTTSHYASALILEFLRLKNAKCGMFTKAMAKSFMYKVPAFFKVCFVIIIVREESQIVLKFRRNLSANENSAAIFLVFQRVNPIAQRAYYRFLHCCYRFLYCVTDFCTVLGDVWD